MRRRWLLAPVLPAALLAAAWDRELTALDNSLSLVFSALSSAGLWRLEDRDEGDAAYIARTRWMFDFKSVSGWVEPRATAAEASVPRPAGGGAVPVVVWTPAGRRGEALPLVVWCHGGGYVVGNAWEPVAAQLAAEVGAVVVSPDYRLAPEHRCPAAIDDVWAVLRHWADPRTGAAAGAGADPARVAVAGISAGGGLAAAAAQRARNASLPLRAQALLVPMLAFDPTAESYVRHGGNRALGARAATWLWRRYCGGGPADGACASASCQPPAGDVAGTAAAVVLTADRDVLAAEGEAYARQLRAAGVATTHIATAATHVGAGVQPSTMGKVYSALRAALR